MIKEALQYIVGLSAAKVQDVILPDGTCQTYSDKPLTRLTKHIPYADEICMNNLSSLIDYIKSGIDEMAEKMIIQVISPERVKLFSQLDEERNRELLVDVKAQVPSFNFEMFIEHEAFIINAQSKFIDDDMTDKALLLKFAGTVESGTVADYGDDGVTQKATVKTGIASKSDAVVPNPVKLKPFRTFVEVEQPISEFIFRIKQDKCDGIACALFEADGGAWKNEAMYNIKKYLENELADYKEQFTIIS